MPDISILVDIADYYDISIPEIISGERLLKQCQIMQLQRKRRFLRK